MNRFLALTLAFSAALTLPTLAQKSESGHLDISTDSGNLHVGKDADASKAGLPLYPGARLKTGDDKSDQANLSLLTEAFGMKLIVAHYVSEDAPAKVIDFYRGKLRRYGKVLECHSERHGGSVDVHDVHDDDKDPESSKGKELKCEQNSGPVVELKAGTEDNQHVVAVESGDNGKGASFALVYVHTRGKKGEI